MKALHLDAELVVSDLLDGRLVLRSVRPRHRAAMVAVLKKIAAGALEALIDGDEFDPDGGLEQLDDVLVTPLPSPATGLPS